MNKGPNVYYCRKSAVVYLSAVVRAFNAFLSIDTTLVTSNGTNKYLYFLTLSFYYKLNIMNKVSTLQNIHLSFKKCSVCRMMAVKLRYNLQTEKFTTLA